MRGACADAIWTYRSAACARFITRMTQRTTMRLIDSPPSTARAYWTMHPDYAGNSSSAMKARSRCSAAQRRPCALPVKSSTDATSRCTSVLPATGRWCELAVRAGIGLPRDPWSCATAVSSWLTPRRHGVNWDTGPFLILLLSATSFVGCGDQDRGDRGPAARRLRRLTSWMRPPLRSADAERRVCAWRWD